MIKNSGVFGDIMIYDIFEHLVNNLTVKETVSLLLINKQSYTTYTDNRHYCDKLLVRKILESFGVKYKCSNKYNKVDNSVKILLKIYWYFKGHVKSNIVDVLIYMIDNDIDDDWIFELFASNCKFRGVNINCDTRVINDNIDVNIVFDNISLDDMKYILVYGSEKKINVILDMFTIPVLLISHVIHKILTRGVFKTLDTVLIKFIKYLFVKHCYGRFLEEDSSYIHSIITILIKYKKTAVLKYFLDKKNKYSTTSSLDYQYLVNRCIEYEDRTHLKILLRANEIDNTRFVNKTFVIINTHYIIQHCKNARFDYIGYLVEHCLGDSINASLYIDSICQGIELLILSKRNSFLLQFEKVTRYLTLENLDKINMYIKDIYDSGNVKITNRIFV